MLSIGSTGKDWTPCSHSDGVVDACEQVKSSLCEHHNLEVFLQEADSAKFKQEVMDSIDQGCSCRGNTYLDHPTYCLTSKLFVDWQN